MKYPVHAVLMNFSAEFKRNVSYNGHSPVGFLPVDYNENYSGALVIDEQQCSENTIINEKSEFWALENIIAQKTASKGYEENMKVLHSEIQSILNGFYRFHDEGLKVTMLSSSCWMLVTFVVSYGCDIPEGRDMFGVRNGTMVRRLQIQCLLSHEAFAA